MYCGCKTCCSKLTWTASVLLLLAAAAALAAGLYVTVPCIQQMVKCGRSTDANTAANQCWNNFWQCTKSGNAGGLFFILACCGAACLLLSFMTCCCFCCQRRPGAPPRKSKKAKKQEQFMASDTGAATAPAQATGMTTNDAAPYSDQFAAYSGYPAPGVKPSVAHV